MPKKLLTIGTSFVDIKGFPVKGFIPRGRNEGKMLTVHGGVARNIAEDVARLGAESYLLSLIDNNGIGEDMIRHLKETGVNTEYIGRVDGGMGTWLAIFDCNNDVYANVSLRPDLRPMLDILKSNGDDMFSKTDAVLLEFDIDEPVIAMVFEQAQKHGKPVYGAISNMEVARHRSQYFGSLECLVCNRIEAGQLLETEFTGLSPEEALKTIGKLAPHLGFSKLVVTMDDQGAIYYERNGSSGYSPSVKTEVVDTTGAGDAFFSAIAWGMTEGMSLADACRLGNEAAARVISRTENVL